METYVDKDHDSSVLAFEYDATSITIRFSGTSTGYVGGEFVYYNTYKYTYSSAGGTAIETMKLLAQDGENLNAYINNVRPQYSNKWNS